MKKAFIFLSVGSVVSIFVLFYIFQNVRLIQSSYRIQKKEKELTVKSDRFKELHYELLALHSPSRLEEKLAQSQVDLIRPTDVKVIHHPVSLQPTFLAHNQAREGFAIFRGIEFVPEAHANSTQQ